MRGLIRSTSFYSKKAALADHAQAAAVAFGLGLAIPALPVKAGHKVIDRCTEAILAAIATARPAPAGTTEESR